MRVTSISLGNFFPVDKVQYFDVPNSKGIFLQGQGIFLYSVSPNGLSKQYIAAYPFIFPNPVFFIGG